MRDEGARRPGNGAAAGPIECIVEGSPRRFKPYPAYKESGVEWLGEVPTHWEVKKTTWLFSIGSGTTPQSEDAAYYGGDTPWITTSELRESVVTLTTKSLTEKALRDYSTLKIHPKGSVAVAMYGATIGRLGILGVPAAVNQACCVFSNPRGINTSFWFYWLQMRRPYLISLGYGGGQPNLSQELLRSVCVPTPQLSEQRAIAAFLDRETARIDTLVAKKERLIDLLHEKRTTLLTRAVTKGLDPNVAMKDSGVEWLGRIPAHWKLEKLGHALEDVMDFRGRTPHKLGLEWGGEIPAISAVNVRDSYIDLSRGVNYGSDELHNRWMASGPTRAGDIVYTTEAPLGNVALVPDDRRYILSQRVVLLRPKPSQVKTPYLLLLLRSSTFLHGVSSVPTFFRE